MEGHELRTSNELAGQYGLLRDQMELLLIEIKATVHHVGGETRLDAAEVAELLAGRDRAALKEIVAFLDGIANFELAEDTLREMTQNLLDEWLHTTDEAIGKDIEAAKRAIRGRLRSFALERTRTEKQTAGTPEGTKAAAWKELHQLQQFRDDLLNALRGRRGQRPSPGCAGIRPTPRNGGTD